MRPCHIGFCRQQQLQALGKLVLEAVTQASRMRGAENVYDTVRVCCGDGGARLFVPGCETDFPRKS